MIPYRIIQAWFNAANNSGTDVMRWSDFLATLSELKFTDTTAYTTEPVSFDDLPEHADEAAATTGGLVQGNLYRTATGEIRVKLPDP